MAHGCYVGAENTVQAQVASVVFVVRVALRTISPIWPMFHAPMSHTSDVVYQNFFLDVLSERQKTVIALTGLNSIDNPFASTLKTQQIKYINNITNMEAATVRAATSRGSETLRR